MEDKVEKKHTKRTHARVHNIDHIVNFMDAHSLSQTEMADTLGISGTTICTWLKQKNCPKWTQLAIEGLRRRHKNESENTVILCMPDNRKQILALNSFLEATGITRFDIKHT